jgi:hypothetical protein
VTISCAPVRVRAACVLVFADPKILGTGEPPWNVINRFRAKREFLGTRSVRDPYWGPSLRDALSLTLETQLANGFTFGPGELGIIRHGN